MSQIVCCEGSTWKTHKHVTHTKIHTHTCYLIPIISKQKSPLFFSFFNIVVVGVCLLLIKKNVFFYIVLKTQDLNESQGVCLGSPSLTVLMVSVDIKQHSAWTTQFTPQNIYGKKKKKKKKNQQQPKLTIYVALVGFIYLAFTCQPGSS